MYAVVASVIAHESMSQIYDLKIDDVDDQKVTIVTVLSNTILMQRPSPQRTHGGAVLDLVILHF